MELLVSFIPDVLVIEKCQDWSSTKGYPACWWVLWHHDRASFCWDSLCIWAQIINHVRAITTPDIVNCQDGVVDMRILDLDALNVPIVLFHLETALFSCGWRILSIQYWSWTGQALQHALIGSHSLNDELHISQLGSNVILARAKLTNSQRICKYKAW